MSFVLEALKKQEADRDADAAVSLVRSGVERSRYRRWMALFAIAMTLNVALVAWLMWGGSSPDPTTRTMTQQPAPPVQERAPERDTVMAVGATASPAAALAAETPAAEPSPAAGSPSADRPYGLDELSPGERRRFPGIAFSAHIYAEDATLRAVVAHGQRHQEGDRVRGLEILQITADGVVLAFENKRVKVPLAVEWDDL